ncbi:hypothetical protein [Pantoea conspicua]|nr:hypothetical protein [Pantoea conspicua]
MPNQNVIPPYEQMYRLNQQLILNADRLQYAVVTVGGQAVQYWISAYYDLYNSSRLPDDRLTTSIDCDYSARKDDIAAIAETLNVKFWSNKGGNPPSLAQFMLIDRDTDDIKQIDDGLFAVPDDPEVANTVDIIDKPGGFERVDFLGTKLHIFTTPFLIESTGPNVPEMHEKVRVLNPIACVRSRFSNLIDLRRDPEVENSRINALKIPCFYFLLEVFDKQPYDIAREIYLELWQLACEENSLRHQAFWECWHGPLLEDQQSNNISLLDVLEKVHKYLSEHLEDFDIPPAFVEKELPIKLAQLREKFKRYIELNYEHAARGRRGFERNRRDD